MHDRAPEGYMCVDIYSVPPRLRDKMCLCGQYSAMDIKRYRKGPPICGKCDGVVRWFFHKCVECHEYFIRDFRHPAFCNFDPTCWKHTLELERRYCVTHKVDPDSDIGEIFAIIVEPIGLNPRTFTASELEDVFDF